MKNVNKSVLIWYSPEEMYRLVTDVERYPEFLPWVAGAKLHEKSDRELQATLEMQRGGVRERFSTRNTFERPAYMTMRLVDGPFRLLEGGWKFSPIGTAGTRIELEMRFEFASAVVSMLFGKSFEESCNSLIDAFIARARQKHVGP